MDFLPIPITAVLAVVFVAGFLGWSVFWEDRREVNRLDQMIESFDDSDEDFEIEYTGHRFGKHGRWI